MISIQAFYKLVALASVQTKFLFVCLIIGEYYYYKHDVIHYNYVHTVFYWLEAAASIVAAPR